MAEAKKKMIILVLVDESYVKASISRRLKKVVQENHGPQIVMEMGEADLLVNEDSALQAPR
ncbi:2064_t:CDS:1, partial [Paraglomus occultum]